MNQVIAHLNQQLANCNVLYVKVQNYHWNVSGEHFFELHAKFQELYEQLPPVIDEIAERILTIGGVPAGTMEEFIDLATISEANKGETAEQMVKQLERDYHQLAQELKQGIQISESNHDPSTADLYTGLASSFEKTVWMLRSYLKTSLQHA
jgi:starvation-inducible DNA-binding protein